MHAVSFQRDADFFGPKRGPGVSRKGKAVANEMLRQQRDQPADESWVTAHPQYADWARHMQRPDMMSPVAATS